MTHCRGMSACEKFPAWHIEAMTGILKAEATKVASASESTIANMRKVFSQLEAKVNAAPRETLHNSP